MKRELQNFLEISTIHGLQHISTARNCVRPLWFCVVFTSFISAGYIISLSYKSWQENPITTTVDIIPMSQIKFPKVTVCPPKGTYTSLNYDIMKAERINLNNETRQMFTDFSLDVIQETLFHSMMKRMNIMQEKNRYYNLYKGYSKFDNPYYQCIPIDLSMSLNQCNLGSRYNSLTTYVTSGSISTYNFGKPFNNDNFNNFIEAQIEIFVPDSISNQTNSVLYLDLKKNPENSTDLMFQNENVVLAMFPKNISNPHGSYVIKYETKYSYEDLQTLKQKEIPGFKLSWFYNNDVEPQSKFSNEQLTREFVRYISTFVNFFFHLYLCI